MKLAPIVLFVYNRPEHTAQTISSLKKNELAGQSDLIVYSDGPKGANDSNYVESVRRIIKDIDGFKSLTIIEREANCGLAANIIDGVTEIVNKFDRIIVLEDDLVTSPVFISFMNQALEHFRDTEKVMQISGYMFDVDIKAQSDAIFLPFISSWGWATWKRAWEHFDPLMLKYGEVNRSKELQFKFNLEGAHEFFNMLKKQMKGKIDSWAIRWYLSVFMMDGLALYPVKTFVQNIGLDGSGTHCSRSSISKQPMAINSLPRLGFRFPEASISKESYQRTKILFSAQRSIKAKLQSASSKIVNFIK